jgi:hypothetical protein
MKFSTKLFLTAFLILVVGYLHEVFSPVIETQIAVGQAEDTTASYTNMHTYKWFIDYYWVLWIVIPALFLGKDVYQLIKNKNNEEN